MSGQLRDCDLVLREYLVVVVDILGQSELLKSVRFPANKREEAALVPVLKATYGLVKLFRATFSKFFETFRMSSSMASVRCQELDRYRPRHRQFEVTHYGVGDSMFVGVPLDRDGQAIGLYATMYALAGVHLTFLSRGHFLRGAVDVGIAADVFPGELYGPAVAGAYHLEKDVAKYPRIIIGGWSARRPA